MANISIDDTAGLTWDELHRLETLGEANGLPPEEFILGVTRQYMNEVSPKGCDTEQPVVASATKKARDFWLSYHLGIAGSEYEVQSLVKVVVNHERDCRNKVVEIIKGWDGVDKQKLLQQVFSMQVGFK